MNEQPAASTEQATASVLTLKEVRKRLKKGTKVLWVYRDNVEEGDVWSVRGDSVDLKWLEGYKSRDDTVLISEILAINDNDGPHHAIFPFSGNGHMTEAAEKWLAVHPNPVRG